jgi:4-hydroxy-tetrahydrodipicolinate synthase
MSSLKPITPGAYTALITPFQKQDIYKVDVGGLRKLINFQISNGITGILAAGTTGESPTLTWDEHVALTYDDANKCRNQCDFIAGAGSNNYGEAHRAILHASKVADKVLIVDPYYNGPSSLEIRKEYLEPLAQQYPNVHIIPYVIPGRTGTKLLPEDLAILSRKYPNISAVKEATGDLDNMKRTRKCCGPDLKIFSGDDGMTFEMMTNLEIMACGVISVISNIAPKAVSDMVQSLLEGNVAKGEKIANDLKPLFDIVTVITTEDTLDGPVECKARNPLAIKTLMQLLDMPSGPCRPPLGKMTINGFNKVVIAARKVWQNSPYIFEPIAQFFNINIEERLYIPKHTENLYYDSYF